jgi:hypothetical protein
MNPALRNLSRPMARYAAKLLFQFHFAVKSDPRKRRLCEERIINFAARSPRETLQIAKLRGKGGEPEGSSSKSSERVESSSC